MSCDLAGFVPPFCPNPACRLHLHPEGWNWKHDGFHSRACPPHRVPRYRCKHCRRSFSSQTFSTTYWLRRPDLLPPLFWRLLACSAFRQIAREFAVAPSTIAGQAARLGRHALLYHQRHRPRTGPTEPLVIDGFESFEWSQFHPCHFHLAVGAQSHFFYGFTDSELRRKGRMTARQKIRRAQLEARFGRPDPRSIEQEVAALVRLVAPDPKPLIVLSDEHPAYPRALRSLPHATVHEVTSSRARRTADNPLFPINLLDLLIRHGSANHKRETIAFSKRRQGAAERLAVLLVWRNYMKRFSERRGGPTPAMRLGLRDRPVILQEILVERLFPSRLPLPPRWQPYYWRTVPTRELSPLRLHRCSYAA
jgi:hypothetical protein